MLRGAGLHSVLTVFCDYHLSQQLLLQEFYDFLRTLGIFFDEDVNVLELFFPPPQNIPFLRFSSLLL